MEGPLALQKLKITAEKQIWDMSCRSQLKSWKKYLKLMYF